MKDETKTTDVPAHNTVRKLARLHLPETVQALADIVGDDNAPFVESVNALEVLLTHGYVPGGMELLAKIVRDEKLPEAVRIKAANVLLTIASRDPV